MKAEIDKMIIELEFEAKKLLNKAHRIRTSDIFYFDDIPKLYALYLQWKELNAAQRKLYLLKGRIEP